MYATQISSYIPDTNACLACPTRGKCLASQLNDKQLALLAQCGQLGRQVPKGTLLYRQDDPVSSLHSVKTGAVKTYQLDAQGRTQVTGFKLAGSAFGLIDMPTAKRSEYAETVTDSVICGFSSKRLRALMLESPSLLENFIQQCSQQMQRQQANAKDDEAPNRVIRFLQELQQDFSRPGVNASGFTLPMSNKDIANYLRVRPETLSRVFQQLKAEQKLELKGRTVMRFDAPNHSENYAPLRLAS